MQDQNSNKLKTSITSPNKESHLSLNPAGLIKNKAFTFKNIIEDSRENDKENDSLNLDYEDDKPYNSKDGNHNKIDFKAFTSNLSQNESPTKKGPNPHITDITATTEKKEKPNTIFEQGHFEMLGSESDNKSMGKLIY